MKRQLGQISLRFVAMLTVAVTTSGCGQLFQRSCQPGSAAVRNLEDATWRLTFTNNPGQRYRQYDFMYSFEILSFDRQFGFNIKRVVRNRQFNQPIQQGTYDTNGSGLLVMQFQNVTGGENGEQQTSNAGTSQFDMSLGSRLTLRDRKTGYIYRYHQFVGVVSPSTACVFK